MVDAHRIAALKAELAETQEAGAAMVVLTIQAMGATPEQMARLADEYQDIADGRQRSRITAIIAQKVAERLRDEAG
jgi:DNA-binding transcriptional regulator YbjK